jgi:hypothetical protein
MMFAILGVRQDASSTVLSPHKAAGKTDMDRLDLITKTNTKMT